MDYHKRNPMTNNSKLRKGSYIQSNASVVSANSQDFIMSDENEDEEDF